MEIKHNIQTGDVEFVTYIGGDGYTAPIVLKSDGTIQNYLYLQRDYQGSIVAISNATGQVLEKRLFDAWGNVLVQDGAGNTLSGLTILDRGYTGHEHLQNIGLIHMNGRLYDAKLHRFLQPDNYVQDPTNTQNYNRYGYVLNNPLKYIDPSGEQTSPDCDTCGGSNLDNTQYGNGIIKSILEDPNVKEWLSRNFSARNIDEAGTAVGKAARDATNFVVGNVRRFFKGLFGGNKNSGPPPNMGTNVNMNSYTSGGGNNSFSRVNGINNPQSSLEKLTNLKNDAIVTEGFTTVIETTGQAGKYVKGLGKFAGITGSLAEVSKNTLELQQRKISPRRFGFRTTGTATSAFTGAIIGGEFGAWPGFLAGLSIGGMFDTVEVFYNTAGMQIRDSFNQFVNTTNSAVINAGLMNN
ncbi:MAG: hypothetical protein B7Z06_06640, partial [Flavobacteriales bacterium 32-35-8]